jgi:hypothetical protein
VVTGGVIPAHPGLTIDTEAGDLQACIAQLVGYAVDWF